MNLRIATLCGIACSSIVLMGCDAPAPTTRTYSLKKFQDVPSVSVWNAAEKAVSERFRIDRDKTRRHQGIIISEPVESMETVSSLRMGDVLGAKRRVRRYVEVHVSTGTEGTRVFCKVPVQVWETEEQVLYSKPYRQSTDYPADTPIDHDAATTPEQNAVWRTRSRDKILEREILESIQELISGKPVKQEQS